MPHLPKVSVCIPSYNHARYLPQTLDGVLGQTYQDFEVVVVDDGSTDGSLEVLEAYAARHPEKVRVFTHPGRENRGISPTANLAFEKSRGEYWAGLTSDDVWYADALESLVAHLDAHPEAGIVYGRMSLMDEEGRPAGGVEGSDVNACPDPLSGLIQRNPIPAVTVMARRECFERYGGFRDGLVYSDWELWIRFVAQRPAGFIDRPLCRYRVHSYNSSVGIPFEADLRHRLAVMASLRDNAEADGGGLLGVRRRALIDLQFAFLRYHLGDMHGVRADLEAAFTRDPSLRGDVGFLAAWLRDREEDVTALRLPPDRRGRFAGWVLARLPPYVGERGARDVASRYGDLSLRAAAAESYQAGDLRAARRRALRCVANDPRRLADRGLLFILAESALGAKTMGALRRLRGRLHRP
ncbi:MAG TPA: glycosyltransferase [Pyrinomonadaceae bacterium]